LLREQRRLDGPGDAEVGVVPGETALVVGAVVVRALVEEVGLVGEDAEAVGEAGRDPELAVVLVRERDAVGAAEGGRAAPEVHDDVVDGAAGTLDELALGVAPLEVEAAEGAPPRTRVVVLHERGGDAVRAVALGVVALEEEPARVGEDAGLDEQDARDLGLVDGQGCGRAIGFWAAKLRPDAPRPLPSGERKGRAGGAAYGRLRPAPGGSPRGRGSPSPARRSRPRSSPASAARPRRRSAPRRGPRPR